ncbi:hypothetical protein AGMMS50218_04070 [Actinomycetota bacterium]|nr:hypothetical protein AGMMS50218_04070 [Actinomycetota bacterium]
MTAAGGPGAGASDAEPGQLVAVPGDGSEPGTGMDIGGPGLEQRCIDGDLPLPLDMVASVSCVTVPDSFDVTQPMGPALSGVTLDPGTYWVVLVCSGPGGFTFGSAVPGLSAEVEVPCPEDGRAARQKLGTVTDAADGNITGHPSTGGATYAFWLVREGKSTL